MASAISGRAVANQRKRKEAERQAMINATGMTNDQEASLLTINQEHEASVKALFETMKSMPLHFRRVITA